MAFVYLGGNESTKPTYFEVVAADKLVPSLKAAVVYTLAVSLSPEWAFPFSPLLSVELSLLLQVLSQRHSWVQRLVEYDDEMFAAISMLLEWHSLSTSDATFAEGLYGLTRRRLGLDSAGKYAHMTPSLRRLAWLLQVDRA